MGLLDNLENQTLDRVFGNTSGPLATAILQMIQNHPGGLQGLVQSFHEKGLGDLVSAWVSTGPNPPASETQIHQVLGSDRIQQLASAAGMSPDAAGSGIAQLLPALVDKLTPNGQVPEHGGVMEIASGLLRNLTAKAS